MGTPAITLPAFEALIKDKRFDIVAAYTQPDRPVGRHAEPMPTPVKVHAQKYDIPVYQPLKISDTTVEQIKVINPDLIVVFAYSAIIPKDILDIPQYGCVNIHPSLLPKHRGPSPITNAIEAGDEVTGVTYMLMDDKIDHGPIIKQYTYNITSEHTGGQLTEELTGFGARNLVNVLVDYIEGKISPTPQDHKKATHSKLLKREHGKINWGLPADEIERKIRAYNPWPGTYCMWGDKKLKIISAKVGSCDQRLEPGQVQDGVVGTGKGNIQPIQVQLEGKKPMQMNEFINGNQDFENTKLN